MEDREITYVDDHIKELYEIVYQIDFVIDVMGGQSAKLNPERRHFRSFLNQIHTQVTDQMSFLSSCQDDEINKDVSRLSEIKEIKEIIEQGHLGLDGNLELIRKTLKQINDFVENDFREILRLSRHFEKTEKEISRALTATSEGEIRAQDDVGQQPDSQISLAQ